MAASITISYWAEDWRKASQDKTIDNSAIALYKRSRSLTLEHLGPGGQDGLVALELPPAAEEDSVRELRILESGAEVLAQSTLGNLNTR